MWLGSTLYLEAFARSQRTRAARRPTERANGWKRREKDGNQPGLLRILLMRETARADAWWICRNWSSHRHESE